MGRRSTLRASDAEREEIAERLREATAEGRLLAEELEERLGLALTARTHGELSDLVADLPRPREVRSARRFVPRTAPEFALAILVAMVAVVIVIGFAILLAGVLMAWGFWVLLAWWCFSRGRRAPRGGRNPYYFRRGPYGPRLYR